MSYYFQSILSEDSALKRRVIACAWNLSINDPVSWVDKHIWKIAITPGLAEAYKTALDNDNPEPCADESVITDAQITALVESFLN